MSDLQSLRPHSKARVMDLLASLGMDVSDWANYKNGKSNPAANPKYCYEWAFVEAGKFVVLNLWWEAIKEVEGVLSQELNYRELGDKVLSTSRAGVWRNRCRSMDASIRLAFEQRLPVRVILCSGERRNPDVPDSPASKVRGRTLDAAAWMVTRYNNQTGACVVTRGASTQSVPTRTPDSPVLTGRVGSPHDSTAWTREEVEACVADYLHMLTLELTGQSYNKTTHRLALQFKLRSRTEGSIERKHQNISAVFIELGCPYISGYKPLGNYQQLLFEVVADRVLQDQLFDRSATAAVEQPATTPLTSDFSSLLTDAPSLESASAEQKVKPYRVKTVGVFRDYFAREARNRSLGIAGEEFVLAYERHRLHSSGAKRLSDRVEHISTTKGDGLGYDVLSFDADGRERFIEVKTTTFGRETPFFVSHNEVEFSKSAAEQFHLYRLFEFRRQPRMFDLHGSVQRRCHLDPVTYLARFS